MHSAKVGAMDSEGGESTVSEGGHLISPKMGTQSNGSLEGARFDKGDSIIDFVLAYMVEKDEERYEEKTTIRGRYLDSLVNNWQLELEVAVEGEEQSSYGSIEKEEEKDAKMHYIKVHAPIETLYRVAEDLKMKMPTKESDIRIKKWYSDSGVYNFYKKYDGFQLRNPTVPKSKKYFVQIFESDRLSEFANHDDPDKFFSPAERGRLVHSLLTEASYGDDSRDIGIENLIQEGIFLDAYPLHDGPVLTSWKDAPVNNRQRLQKDWASFRCLFKYQPIEGIREYFGEKIALYFAWLGFYTSFLLPAAIVGIICFIYGIAAALESYVVQEACTDPIEIITEVINGTTVVIGTAHKFLMCPQCDRKCPYYYMNSTCMYAKVSHFFDNGATVFFAIFMSIWSEFFLEFWKRTQFTLSHKWHSLGFEETEEQVRPEYSSLNKTLKLNPVTMKQEPYMPKGIKYRRVMGAMSVVLFFVLLILAAVVGVVVLRAALSAILLSSPNALVRSRSSIIVSALAAVVNLIVINILKFFYNKCAVLLTDWENPRTRTDYEDSFTSKMFLFQFVNTYASIFYIAFFKGATFTGRPGNYHHFAGNKLRVTGCSAQGCFLQLAIQLIVIMVGQQFISNFFETLLPTVKKWWHERKSKQQALAEGRQDVVQPQWADDYEGEMQTKFSLFWEYLEIVLQYGFVTMFVAGFPLAPLFALLNNVLEIRVDAYNYVSNCRRPIARRAEDIGAWYGILESLTRISVLINAFVIAFTSTFIDRMVYRHTMGHQSLKGFLNWSLSTFNVSQFKTEVAPENPWNNGTKEQWYCRFPGHYETNSNNSTITRWKILCARLAFVIAIVFFVYFVTWLVAYIIPDIPKSVELRIKREKFLESEADKEHKDKSGKRRSSRPSPRVTKVSADGEIGTSAL